MEVYHWATLGNEYSKYLEYFPFGKILHNALSDDGAVLWIFG